MATATLTNAVWSASEFPDVDLGAKAEVMLSTGTWLDVTSRVFQDSSVVIGRGHPDESTTASPSTLAATLDNSDGALSNLNPLSPYFGQLPFNTPVRVSVPEGQHYLDLQQDGAGCAQANLAVALPASFEVQVDIDAINLWNGIHLASRWSSANNERQFSFRADANGHLEFDITTDGTFSTRLNFTSTAPLPRQHGRMSLRVVYQYTAGTGATCWFYTGDPGLQNWRQLGISLSVASPTVSLAPFAANGPVQVGAAPSDTDMIEGVLQGKVYAFALLPEVGTLAQAYAGMDFTALAPGTQAWTDPAGNSWSMTGLGAVNDRDYRFTGNIAAWPQAWTPGDPNARTAISGGGPLRRLGQSQDTGQSVMYRAYTLEGAYGEHVSNYWPMETMQGAPVSAQLTDVVGTASPVVWNNGVPTLGSSSVFACSGPLPVVNGAQGQVYAPRQASTGTTVVRFLAAIPATDSTNFSVCRINYSGGTIATLDLVVNTATGMEVVAYGQDGSVLYTNGYTVSQTVTGTPFGLNARWSFEILETGTNTFTANVVYLEVGASEAQVLGVNSGANITGTVGVPTSVIFNHTGGRVPATGLAVGHLSVENNWVSLFNLASPLNAYTSETAGARIQRLCREEGIPCRVIGSPTNSPAMGPQTAETVSALIQECADLDRGMLAEARAVNGFQYTTRRAMLGQPNPFVTFDYSQDQLSEGLAPTIDDQVMKNDVTATSTQTSGSARQVLNDGSPNSVSLVGQYDTQIDVNTYQDSQLTDAAGWALHTLSASNPRYKALPVDMANRAIQGLWYQVRNVEIGDRAYVINPPAWLPPGQIDQIIQGVTETIGFKKYQLSWNGVPGEPFYAAFADDPIYGRVDTSWSQLSASAPVGVLPSRWGPRGGSFATWDGYQATIDERADGTMLVTAGTSVPYWQASSPFVPASAGQVWGAFINMHAMISANAAAQIVFGFETSSGTQYFSVPSVEVLNGQQALLYATATAPAGTTGVQMLYKDNETATGYQALITDAYMGVVSTLSVRGLDGFPWTTATTDWPFDVTVAGERMTVVSVGAASGSPPVQTFTCIPGVNGLVKAHVAGDDVRLSVPTYATP